MKKEFVDTEKSLKKEPSRDIHKNFKNGKG